MKAAHSHKLRKLIFPLDQNLKFKPQHKAYIDLWITHPIPFVESGEKRDRLKHPGVNRNVSHLWYDQPKHILIPGVK